MKLLILDIDGTLADLSQRENLIEKQDPTKEDWDAFFSPEMVEKDQPIEEAKKAILSGYLNKFDKVIFITGRPESLRKTTLDWLNQHLGLKVDSSDLYMRPEEARLPSASLKKAIINQKIKPKYGNYDWTFIDDEDDNLEVFQSFGETLKAPDCWEALINTGDINAYAKNIRLSARDFLTLVNAIENPPEPNEKLKKAAKNYKKLGMPAREMEGAEQLFREVYELIYKYQMLNAQEYLTDRANIAFMQIEERLVKKLQQGIEIILDAAIDWRRNEEKHILREMSNQVYDLLHGIPREDLKEVFIEIYNILGREEIIHYFSEIHEFEKEELEDAESPGDMFDIMWDSDYAGAPVAQGLAGMINTLFETTTFKNKMRGKSKILDEFIGEETEEKLREYALENELPQVRVIENMIQEIWDGRRSTDLTDLIIKFNIGLNTVHHNGPLATWILGRDAINILNDISDNAPIEKWNEELQRLMGRDVSFQPVEVEWFQPEAFKKKASSYWKEGESLRTLGYPQSHVQIYRALPATGTMVDNEDFITLSRQFAKDHAVTSAVYNEEPFYVIRKLVPAENVVGASNPEEYKWHGESFEGDPIYVATPDGDIQYMRYGNRKKAMAFEAIPPESNPTFGTETHPGFHTTGSFDIAASYAISKVYANHTHEDENEVWYVDDYPVVIEIDMEGLTKELDYDAINFVQDHLTTALDEFGREFDVEEMDDDELERELESFAEGLEREIRIDSPLDAIGEYSFSHFETPLYPLLSLPNTTEVVRNYFITGEIPAEALMQVTDQYRYTTDVDERRLKKVSYVAPVAGEMATWGDDETSNEEREKEYPGFNILWEDDVYSGTVNFENKVIWEGDLGEVLYPGQISFPFAEDVEPEIEYHGTTYNRLLSAVPQLASVLPRPPTPPYRESAKTSAYKRKRGINTYYNFRPDYTIEEIIHKWLRDGDKLQDAVYHGYHPLEDVMKYKEKICEPDKSKLSTEEWEELKCSLDAGWDESQPLILSICKDGRVWIGEGNHRATIAKDLFVSDPIEYAHLKEIPVKFVFWNGYEDSEQKLQKEQEDLERAMLEQQQTEITEE